MNLKKKIKEIFDYEYDNNPKFFIIASDGVFEYWKNEEVKIYVLFNLIYHIVNDSNYSIF